MSVHGRSVEALAFLEMDLVEKLRAAGCVFAEDEAAVLATRASGAELEALVGRRLAGEPLEYLVGRVEFAGLRLAIRPGVFIPRRRSEMLVEQALARLPRDRPPVVLDLCCGNGALGAAIKAAVPVAEVYAADLSPAAVACARENLGADVYEGDLFRPLPRQLRGYVDVLLANVPYVPTDAIATMPPEARDHEPRAALDGGADGLDVLRRLAPDAPDWLAPRGELLTECAPEQAEPACAILAAAGLGPTVHRDPDRGATVVIARNNVGSC